MNSRDVNERRTAWAMLILCPLSMMAIYAYITAGLAPGLDAGHPMEYLQATCIMWAVVTLVIPLLRLLRFVALPLWFTALLYGDLYFYVISLSLGMYLNIAWWGDFTHLIAAMIITSIVFMAICIMHSHSPSHVSFGSRTGIVLLLLFVSASFGSIWEVMEGYTDIITGAEYMSYGALDSLGDLFADLFGVAIMTAIAWFILGRYDAENVASKVRLGRKMIPV